VGKASSAAPSSSSRPSYPFCGLRHRSSAANQTFTALMGGGARQVAILSEASSSRTTPAWDFQRLHDL